MHSQEVLWSEPAQADAVRRDAIALAKFAVTSPDLRDNTARRCSASTSCSSSLTGPRTASTTRSTGRRVPWPVSDPALLEHEHVYPRKWLIEQMLAEPSAVELILTTFALACTVTKDEHRRLAAAERANLGLDGWQRYYAAGIAVLLRSSLRRSASAQYCLMSDPDAVLPGARNPGSRGHIAGTKKPAGRGICL